MRAEGGDNYSFLHPTESFFSLSFFFVTVAGSKLNLDIYRRRIFSDSPEKVFSREKKDRKNVLILLK